MVVSMRLKELTGNLNKEEEIILKDYFYSRTPEIKKVLNDMPFDSLLEISNISQNLFEELHDKIIIPRGERLLSKTNILEEHIHEMIARFENLDRILSSTDEELIPIFGDRDLLFSFNKRLAKLKEKIVMGKDISNLI
jgi:DNA integrity scanning protein DisA with diadenylate cyclase activity